LLKVIKMLGKKKQKEPIKLSDADIKSVVGQLKFSAPFDHAMRNRTIDVLLEDPAIKASAAMAVDEAISDILSNETNIELIRSNIRLTVNTSMLPLLDQITKMSKDEEAVISTLNLLYRELAKQDGVMHTIYMSLIDVHVEDEHASRVLENATKMISRSREKNTDMRYLIKKAGKEVLYK